MWLEGTHGARLYRHDSSSMPSLDAMKPRGQLRVGRYLYWEANAQRSFEIVEQESQSQFLFSQVAQQESQIVASSGVLKKSGDHLEVLVTGTSESHWKLKPVDGRLLVERSNSHGSFQCWGERMEESKEWQAVLAQPVDPGETLLITAAPGSGKSTLLREWCRGRPDSKILLLAFNRAVCQQLEENFKNELANVTVKTIHSFAFAATQHLHHDKVGTATKSDLKAFLGCSWGEVEEQQDLLATFCASADSRWDLDDSKAMELHKALWKHFESGECSFNVPHNVYLKLFQLSPDLQDRAFHDYDILVLDEAQDCTDCMLDIVTRGRFARVIACDPHQNIYQFNNVTGQYLANMHVDHHMSLPLSFRFGGKIADFLTEIVQLNPVPSGPLLKVKGMPNLETSLEILEVGSDPSYSIRMLLHENRKVAVLARKSTTLFLQAMEVVAALHDDKFVHFLGGFKSFKDSHLVPVMDLFYLDQGETDEIHSTYVKRFRSLCAFKRTCKEKEDIAWLSKLAMYEKLSSLEDLQAVIKDIEEKQDTSQADVVFATVHQAKGLGFENVVLLDDFLEDRTTEEFNIFYVACSRVSTGTLLVPERALLNAREPRGRKRCLPSDDSIGSEGDEEEDEF